MKPVSEFDPQMRLETVTMTLRYVGRHADSGFKVELFLTSNDPHDRERFRRREPYPFLGTTAYLPTPEDVVIQKLRWFQRSRRMKDFDDVKNVIDTQSPPNLDLEYIRRWSDQHGSREVLEKILAGATAP